MNSSLNSPARWTTIRAAGLAVVAAAVVLPAANAEATCMVQNSVRYCEPSSNNNPLIISIGRDSSGQWIAYQDTVTGSCTWDMIGNASAFYHWTTVTGTSHSDTIQTVASNGTVVCGFTLGPPSVGAGAGLGLYSGGGYDWLMSYLGSDVTLSCGGRAEGCYFEMWGPGAIYGSSNADYIEKKGSGQWLFHTNAGNDTIYNFSSSGIVAESDCGGGTDHYIGTWDINTVDCEIR